jgi:hypothetical protein
VQRALVYGGRTLNDRLLVFNRMDAIHALLPLELVIHGACPNRVDFLGEVVWSADMLAEEWAKVREIPYCGWPAKWKTGILRSAEGPVRNQLMLDKARPTIAVEFPGGTGTRDMRARLEKAGVRVYDRDVLI